MSDQPIMLGNRYRLDEVIGRGGMAEVWRAWDTRLGRDVAVKRLRVDLATDPTFQTRFQREAQSAASLNHPNIVAVYDTGSEKDPVSGVDIPFIVMELVQGTTLRDLLKDGRQMLPERALEFTAGVLDALAYSHRRGIVHRDIKPGNVMLTTAGTIKVMDFGIARAVSDTSATMTQTAAVIGTAQYLSPEQARGETVDARSDIYSVGCLLYELLTSRPPFVGDSPVSVAYQHVREQPVPPSHIDPELTPDMDTVVLTALAKDPADRYQSAQAMRDDVQRLLDGKPPLGAQAVAAEADPTRILTDRPAPGARPRRGYSETFPVPVVPAAPEDATAVDQDAYDDYDETEPPDNGVIPGEALSDGSEPPKRKLSTAGIVLIALLVVLLTAGGIILYQVMKPTPEVTTVTVPSVIGLSESDARTQIMNAKLAIQVEHEAGPADNTIGMVLRQDPAPDKVVERASTVTVWINDGPTTGTIPDGLVGMMQTDAKAALTAAGFKANGIKVTPAPQGTVEPIDYVAGQVLSVNPDSGSTCPLDGPVELIVATGMSLVPDLHGMLAADATEYAKERGFTVKITPVDYTGECDPGVICTQRPDPGTYELRTNLLYLTVSNPPLPPPPTTTTPSPTESTTPSTPSGGNT